MTEFVHVYNEGGGIRNVSVGEGPLVVASNTNLAEEIAAIGGVGSGGGGTFTDSGTGTYAGGNVTITFPSPVIGASLTITPTVGAVGVDYSGDGGTTWVPAYNGTFTATQTLTFSAVCTDLRIRPISSGDSCDYSVSAPGARITWSGSITFAGGDVIVDLGQTVSLSSAYVIPSAGQIGVDYTTDDVVNSGSTWVPVYGQVYASDSVTRSGPITGWRFRPIASGAAATYTVRV